MVLGGMAAPALIVPLLAEFLRGLIYYLREWANHVIQPPQS